jgi:hypothetical protein
MTIKSRVLAETLFTELIQKQHCDIPAEIHIEPAAIPAIEAKIRLYQFSSILLAVLKEARSKPAFVAVQDYLEQLFFPPTAQQGMDILLDVRGAMKDLSELLTPQERHPQMLWARNWLAGVGVDETNPASLALFALNWMDYYIMVTKSLEEFNPVT